MNLTDNEWIKIYIAKDGTYDKDTLIDDAYYIINRQKAEIENLTALANEFKDKAELLEIEKSAMQHKIDSITAMLERSQEKYELAIDALIRAKTKDIKEFAERLKKSTFDCDVSLGYGNGCYVKAVTTIEIDNLVKKMVGE